MSPFGPKPNTAKAFVMSADRGRPDAGPCSPYRRLWSKET